MLFNSKIFLCVFLPIVFCIYYLPIFKNYQICILLLSSFVFYSYKSSECLFLLILSASLNAIFSYLVYQDNVPGKKRLFAFGGVFCNSLLLFFFKYGSLFYRTFFDTNSLGEWLIMLPLPIGISFYTFQGISLLIDTLHGEISCANKTPKNFFQHFIHTIFFISFFPHSIAGPIVKAHDFLPQICHKELRDIEFSRIFRILILGFFFKTVVADNLQNQTFWIAYPYFSNIAALQLFFMMIGYSIQIFADFAGYSLIAIGIAALFGYRLPANFNFPYIASSFHEFWQRWHMSLSSWLKEYLYIPLGGNKHGTARTYINLFLVMLLGGMWHGAAWNYLTWGCVHGIFLVLERMSRSGGHSFRPGENNYKIMASLRIAFVFLAVSWAWLFFKLPSVSYVFMYTRTFLENVIYCKNVIGNTDSILCCCIYSLPVFIYHFIYYFDIQKSVRWPYYEPIIYAFMLFCILSNGGTSDAFIYFQF